ncbi:MAG TPA: hypothetical protein DDW91_11855 [Shewanella frigidimarina]|nr:hypothetical protein [Shewanella frigidimarina]
MALSQADLTRIALDITANLSNRDRFSRLLTTVRETLDCDAAALLSVNITTRAKAKLQIKKGPQRPLMMVIKACLSMHT